MKKICTAIFSIMIVSLMLFQVFANDAINPGSAEIVTRGEFVVAINEAFNFYNVLGDEEEYTDIKLGDSNYFNFMAARRAGYLNGYPDGSANANNPITRAESALIINYLLKLPQPELQLVFSDDAEIPDWASESVKAVTNSGIMGVNTEGAFVPEGHLTEGALNEIKDALSKRPGRRVDTMLEVASFDGHKITGRLLTPYGEENIDKVVILVHGTGPNTYEMRRENAEYGIRFKYLDVIADTFIKNGAAFYSYNTRGVTLGKGFGLAPDAVIDPEGYHGYTPQNAAHDLKYIVEYIKSQPRLKGAKIFLLGQSEGTIISPLAVNEYGVEADALLLAGYCNDNMLDVIKYQLGGGMSYFNYTLFFNAVGQDEITKEMFEADLNGIRETLLQGIAFEQIDFNVDGVLSLDDFTLMMKPVIDGLLTAIENGDDKWISDNLATNMPPLYTTWFKAHFELPKTEDIMVSVDDSLPMYIFQGTYDANCPVQGTYDVQSRFESLGKGNLTVNIYEGYSHDLNAEQMLYGGNSDAYDDMYELVKGFE
jgi:alpha-beta hydrolase superfamily lysophospholipase